MPRCLATRILIFDGRERPVLSDRVHADRAVGSPVNAIRNVEKLTGRINFDFGAASIHVRDREGRVVG